VQSVNGFSSFFSVPHTGRRGDVKEGDVDRLSESTSQISSVASSMTVMKKPHEDNQQNYALTTNWMHVECRQLLLMAYERS